MDDTCQPGIAHPDLIKGERCDEAVRPLGFESESIVLTAEQAVHDARPVSTTEQSLPTLVTSPTHLQRVPMLPPDWKAGRYVDRLPKDS